MKKNTKKKLASLGMAAIMASTSLPALSEGEIVEDIKEDHHIEQLTDFNENEFEGEFVTKSSEPCDEHDFVYGDWLYMAEKCGEPSAYLVECSKCDYKEEVVIENDHVGGIAFMPGEEPTCEKDGSTEYGVCTGCGEVVFEPTILPAFGHDFSIQAHGKNDVAPTCTEEGRKEMLCANGYCMESIFESIPAKGHTEVIDPAVEGTCSKTGLTEGSHCSDCGEVIVKPVSTPMLGDNHVHTETVEAEPANCMYEGHSEYERCADCHTPITTPTIVPKTEHVFLDTPGYVTEATCTTEGEATYFCGVCGTATKTEKLPLKEHEMGEWEVYKEPTYANNGVEVRECDNCDHKEYQDIPNLPYEVLEERVYEQIIEDIERVVFRDLIIKYPTCTEEGFLVREVKQYSIPTGELTNSYSKEVTMPVDENNHVNVETTYDIEPTCTEAGYGNREVCNDCGKLVNEGEVVEALGHNYVISKGINPTCTEPGLTEGSRCSVCGETNVYQEVIPAKGHNYVTTEGISATCTEPGLTEGSHCDVCGDVLVQTTVIEALGHEMSNWNLVKEATCTEEGLKESDCVRGDLHATEVIPAKGHEMSDWTVTKEATCTETGLKESDCVRCDLHATEEIGLRNHEMGEWTTVKEATCTEAGLRESNCVNCDEHVTEEISAKGHEMGEWRVTKEATCTEPGLKERYCVRGDLHETEVIPAKGHNIVIDEGVKPTTKSEGLTEGSHCADCGEVLVEQEIIEKLKEKETKKEDNIPYIHIMAKLALDEKNIIENYISSTNEYTYYFDKALNLYLDFCQTGDNYNEAYRALKEVIEGFDNALDYYENNIVYADHNFDMRNDYSEVLRVYRNNMKNYKNLSIESIIEEVQSELAQNVYSYGINPRIKFKYMMN